MWSFTSTGLFLNSVSDWLIFQQLKSNDMTVSSNECDSIVLLWIETRTNPWMNYVISKNLIYSLSYHIPLATNVLLFCITCIYYCVIAFCYSHRGWLHWYFVRHANSIFCHKCINCKSLNVIYFLLISVRFIFSLNVCKQRQTMACYVYRK